jgi:TetR/AcrR family transcriptional repressor of mexJK operon
LLQDKGVIGMYRVVIGEVGSNPHVAELFYQAGPQKTIDSLCHYLCQSEELALDHEQCYYWTIHFFNLLKGEFHMRSLLGLDYQLSESQQTIEVDNVVNLLLSLIEKH